MPAFPAKAQFFRKFSVAEFGVDTRQFLSLMQPAYETLAWDPYDAELGKLERPSRKRAIAECMMEWKSGMWTINWINPKPYSQSTDHGTYNRTKVRVYPEMDRKYVNNKPMEIVVSRIADMVLQERSDAVKLRCILTFVRAVVSKDRLGYCALEGGPHYDGMDYIVSALVINRRNIKSDSGVSTVLTPEGKVLLETTLQPAEGIFQDDKCLMHDISSIKLDGKVQEGIRDMIGLDFEIFPVSV